MKNYILLGAIVLVASWVHVYEISEKPVRSNDQKSIYVVSMTADEIQMR